jgi:hypothetical protein
VIVGLIWIGFTAYFGMVLRRDSVEYDDLSYLSIARRYCLEGWLLPAKSYAVATVATAAVLPVLVALVFPVIDGITSGTPLFADLVTAGNNIGYFGFVSVVAPFWPPIGGFLTVLSAYLHDG